ncbi:uncharacterized protein LOC134846454 [Symsagittifera roscoffensis]|uniref:uncharacterized protein LOC134846454 n=1 Tax=Symsagittifera roscoffensis TaxID=84072 RepID=UPI00307B9888
MDPLITALRDSLLTPKVIVVHNSHRLNMTQLHRYYWNAFYDDSFDVFCLSSLSPPSPSASVLRFNFSLTNPKQTTRKQFARLMLTNIAPSLVFRTGKNAPLGVKGGQSGRVAVFNVTLGGSFEVIVTDSDHEDEQKLSDEGCYVMWGSNIFPNWTRARSLPVIGATSFFPKREIVLHTGFNPDTKFNLNNVRLGQFASLIMDQIPYSIQENALGSLALKFDSLFTWCQDSPDQLCEEQITPSINEDWGDRQCGDMPTPDLCMLCHIQQLNQTRGRSSGLAKKCNWIDTSRFRSDKLHCTNLTPNTAILLVAAIFNLLISMGLF